MFVSRSKDFHDFLSLCVVKSPEMRSSAADLLEVRNRLSIIGKCIGWKIQLSRICSINWQA